MKPAHSILLQLVDLSGNHLKIPDVITDIALFTKERFRYSFRLHPTNASGQTLVHYQDLENQRASSAQECLMDYNTSLDECDASVQISVPAMADLQRAHEIATRWAGRGSTPEYARIWLTAKNGEIKAEPVLAKLKDGETLIQVPCVVL